MYVYIIYTCIYIVLSPLCPVIGQIYTSLPVEVFTLLREKYLF